MMTYEKITVLNCIPQGKNNAISRAQLKELTGYTDRAIRRCIAEMVTNQEAAIMSTSNQRGYYLPLTEMDYDEAIANLRKKTNSMLNRLVSLNMMRGHYVAL